MLAYDYQLLLKHLLEHGMAWAPDQEIVYRDRVRYTYTGMYSRVLKLASALQELGVKAGTKVGVIGVPHEKWGERPLALIVLKEDARGRITAATMRQHLQKPIDEGILASWAMPDEFVFVDALPRTSVGKIDKKVLRAQYGCQRVS